MSWFQSRRLKPLLAKIDMERLHEIQQRHAGSTDRYAKYADIERWLKINLARVEDLELHRSNPKEILDLGCGAGFFLFAAKQFGHSGNGLDVDDFPLSNELVDLLQVDRKVWRIKALEPLPDLGRNFDLITGFSTAFNRNEDESRGWDISEWTFLLDDLGRRLKPNGKIFFDINSGKTKKYFPLEVRDLFLRRGASIEGERVLFWRRGTTSVSSS
ncbi:MAG TPA: class I SAM-dependent methyltransferase [Chthoniobacterales bacterium]|nr:class I SAM-dependent methyltransferase [Chthoniobacterales bacterium]